MSEARGWPRTDDGADHGVGNQADRRLCLQEGFGSPENSLALIGLLNAILRPNHPIIAVQILNPFSLREFLTHKIEVHTVELPKYNLNKATISLAGKLEQWVFFLRRASEYTADELRRLLPGEEFRQAIGVIESISLPAEDREMYNQRERAERDYEWALFLTREEALKEGREEGMLDGQIRLLQQLLGQQPATDERLRALSPSERAALGVRLAGSAAQPPWLGRFACGE